MASLPVSVARPDAPPLRQRQLLIAGFVPLVILALGADSRLLLDMGINGQPFSNIAGPLYLLLVLRGLRSEQRLMALLFVPFSAVGEYLFSLIFQLYHYKFGTVPFYVPFGHAILFSTGLLIADLPIVRTHEQRVRQALLAIHLSLFSATLLLFHDTLSVLFGVLFAIILRRKGARPLYLLMGILVLYIELVGTYLGCWVWNPTPWGILHTTNPPVGAFVCYVIADILVMKMTLRLSWVVIHCTTRWHNQTDTTK
jgi:hypothetical protein